jgi:hypothetical protein
MDRKSNSQIIVENRYSDYIRRIFNSIQFNSLLSIKTPIMEQYNDMKNIYIKKKKKRHYDFNDYKINM